MRAIVVGLMLTVAGCAAEPPSAPLVSWQYGSEGTTFPAPEGTYSWTDNGVQSAPIAMMPDAYDPNGVAGTTVRTTPPAPDPVLAAPAPSPSSAAPAGHL